VNLSEFEKKQPQFVDWLKAAGAEILESTNEWELLRFKAGDVTSIVYTNKRRSITCTGDACIAWESFCEGKSWKAIKPTKPKGERSSVLCRTLRARDGDNCFFCAKTVTVAEETVEHLVPRCHKGPNHISNYVLSHGRCNGKAGYLSAMEKVRIHVSAVIAKKG